MMTNRFVMIGFIISTVEVLLTMVISLLLVSKSTWLWYRPTKASLISLASPPSYMYLLILSLTWTCAIMAYYSEDTF